jgi:ABC-2 type transport system permease protein
VSSLVGTASLVRLILRRDRVRIAIWVVSLTVLVAFSAQSIIDLYPGGVGLAEYAVTVQSNAALVAISGPAHGLETLGGRVAWESWLYGVAVGFMALLAVVRHTRAEEQAGRAELVRATVVGRHAAAAAAVLVASATCVLVGALVAATLVAQGLPTGGSLLLGASFAAVGVVFAMVGLVAAQVTEHARAATGLAAAVVGATFVLRAVGDIGPTALSWLSPFGWMQATQPYAGDRWWVLAVSLAAAVALAGAGFALEARRDVGAGLRAPRPGPAVAGPRLAGPFGLAWRLQRASLVGWAVGLGLGGAAMGSVASSADDLVGDNEQMREFLAQLGDASLTDLFLATIVLYLALLATGFGVQSVLRLRGEEAAGRAEPVLATAVGRPRWAASHLAVALGGTTVVLAAGGLGTGVAHALATGDAGQATRVLGAALAYVPAVWVVVGLATALFGLVPRAVLAAWAVLAVVVVVAVFGELFDLPRWLRDLSPFSHVPDVPAAALTALPVVVLLVVAGALVAAGVAGFRRRDLTTT